jgi:hypothetical protein
VICRISHVTIDCRDAYALSRWWSQVLPMSEDPEDPNEPGHEECMIFSEDGRTRLLFIEVPEPKSIKNRLHLDLRPLDGTREQEVERLVGHGATQLGDHRRPDSSGWVTLADPEGNEFCILRGDLETDDPHQHLVQ